MPPFLFVFGGRPSPWPEPVPVSGQGAGPRNALQAKAKGLRPSRGKGEVAFAPDFRIIFPFAFGEFLAQQNNPEIAPAFATPTLAGRRRLHAQPAFQGREKGNENRCI